MFSCYEYRLRSSSKISDAIVLAKEEHVDL